MRAGSFLLSLAIAFSSLASSEYPVGAPELGPAPFLRFATSVGSDGTDFFVVWTDQRAVWDSIIGTRVTASGEILDRTGIPIALGTTLTPAQAPLVVWGGSSYLIFFTNYDSRISTSNLFVVRVDREGRVMGPRQLLATDASAAGTRFAASNGSRTVVGYRNMRSGDVRALVLDQEAVVIADHRLADNSVHRGHVSVAARGSEFAVVWHSQRETAVIEGARITANGELRDPTPLSLGNGLNPHIASDGSDYMLVTLRATESSLLWTSRAVRADLQEVSAVRDLPDGRLLQYPSLVFRGDRYDVVAQRADDVTNLLSLASVRIDRDGTPGGLQALGPLPYGGFDPQPSAGANGSGKVFIAWNDSTREYFSTHIIGRAYGETLPTATPELLLSLSADPQYAPALASSGSGFLATWSEAQGFRATRLTRDGQSLDGRGILLDSVRADGGAAAVFDGTSYVVVSTHGLNVRVRYISPETGAVESVLKIGNDTGAGGVAIAANTDEVFVAWADSYGIQLTRIPHATRMAEMPIRVSPENDLDFEGTFALRPAIASNGSELLVTWTVAQEIIGSPSYQVSLAIYGARVMASTLSLLDPAPLVIGDIAGRSDDESSVTSNGKDWLVVWNGEQSMFARRVRRDSGVQGDAPTAIAAASRGTNNVAWDGARYVLAWKELDWENFPLRLGYVSASGAITPIVTTVSEETLTPQGAIPLVAGPFGLGIAYVRRSTAPEHGSVERTFLRLTARQDKRRAVR